MFQMKNGYTLWYPVYGYKETPKYKHKIINECYKDMDCRIKEFDDLKESIPEI